MGFHINFEAFLYSSIKFSINLLFLKSDECVVFVFVPNILMVLKCQQLRFEWCDGCNEFTIKQPAYPMAYQ